MKTPSGADAADPVVVDDRRRPGRSDDASPELICLLREKADSERLWPIDDEDLNPLSVSRGIKSAIVLSVPIWAIALVLAFWFLR